MRILLVNDRTADAGYPVDSALHQMTDDGSPLVLDPARWDDAEWRDNLGVMDTFEELPASADPARLPAQAANTRRSRLLRCPDCGRTKTYTPEELLKLFGPSGWPDCCGRLMDYSTRPQHEV